MYRNIACLMTLTAALCSCSEATIEEPGLEEEDPIEFGDGAIGPVALTFTELDVPRPRLWFPNTESEQDAIWTAMTTNPLTSGIVATFKTSYSPGSNLAVQNYLGAREMNHLAEIVTRCILQYVNTDPTNVTSECTDALNGVMTAVQHTDFQPAHFPSPFTGGFDDFAEIAMIIGMADAVYSFAGPTQQGAMRDFAKNWYNHLENGSLYPTPWPVATECWWSNQYCWAVKTVQQSALFFLLGEEIDLVGVPAAEFADKIAQYMDTLYRALRSHFALNGNFVETASYDRYGVRFAPWFALKPYLLRGLNFVDQVHLPTAGLNMAIASTFEKPLQTGDQIYGDLWGVPLMYLAALRYLDNPLLASKIRHHLWDRIDQYGGLDRHSHGQSESLIGFWGRFPLMDIAMDATARVPFEPHDYSNLAYYTEPDPSIDFKREPYSGDMGDGRYVDAFLTNDLGDGNSSHNADAMFAFLNASYFGNHKHHTVGEILVQIAGEHVVSGPASANNNHANASSLRRNILLVDPSGNQNYAEHTEPGNYYERWNQTFTTQLDRAHLGSIDVVKVDDLHYSQSPFNAGYMDSERTLVMAKKNAPGGVPYVLDFLKGAYHQSGATVASAKNMAGSLSFRNVPGGTQWYRHSSGGKTAYSGFINTDVNNVPCDQSGSDCHFGASENHNYNPYQQHIYKQSQVVAGKWLTFLQYHGPFEPDMIESFGAAPYANTANAVGGALHFTSGGRDAIDVVMFKKNESEAMVAAGFETDADFIWARYDATTLALQEIEVMGATSVVYNGNVFLDAAETVDIYLSSEKMFLGSGHALFGFPNGVPALTVDNLMGGAQLDVYIDREPIVAGQFGLAVTASEITLMGGPALFTNANFLTENGYTVSDTFFPFFDRGGSPHPDAINITTTASHTAVPVSGAASGSIALPGSGAGGALHSSMAIQVAARSSSDTTQTTAIRIGTTPGDNDVASAHIRRSPAYLDKLRVQFLVDGQYVDSIDIGTDGNGFGAIDLVYEPFGGTVALFDAAGALLSMGHGPTGTDGVYAEMNVYPGGEVDWVAAAEDTYGDAVPRNHAMYLGPDDTILIYAYSFFATTSRITEWRFVTEEYVATAQEMASFVQGIGLTFEWYAPTVPVDPNGNKFHLVRSLNPIGPATQSFFQDAYSTTSMYGVDMGTSIVVF